MEYGKIIAVSGMPGLYELLSSKTDGAIVRSLDDQTTKFVSSRVHSFSHLESIEVYTVKDNVNLVDVFKEMENGSEKIPDGKNNAELKKYFETIFPEIDFERVYTSDMKKMVKWYEVLKTNNIEIKLSEPADEEEELPLEEPKAKEEEESKVTEVTAAKKTTRKKQVKPKETVSEEPAKKTAKKKKSTK